MENRSLWGVDSDECGDPFDLSGSPNGFMGSIGELSAETQMKLCVGVCTAKRPQMLRACLNSLAGQCLPDGLQIDVVVLDNNAGGDARGIVCQFAETAPFQVHYVHEANPGIATGRNRIVAEAVALEADWIVFFDDDEVAEPTWLRELVAATERYRADVVEGATVRLYPETLSRFVVSYQPRLEPDGTPLDYACTSNVIFKTWIVRPDGAGLRFDETFNLLGGEDVDFFLRAKSRGAVIVQGSTARVHETVPAERATFWAQSSRMVTEAAANAFIASQGRHPMMSRPVCAKRIASRTFVGILYLCAAPFCRLAGPQAFEHAVVRAARRLAWATGAFCGMVGWLPKRYLRIQGY